MSRNNSKQDTTKIDREEIEAHQEWLFETLWAQWCALGVLGHAQPWDSSYVDLEALFLATVWSGRKDPRLFDAMLEWVETHGELFSLTRFKNMAQHAPEEVRRLGHSVLKIIGIHAKPGPPAEGETPLFYQKNGRQQPVGKSPDERFAREGYLRSPYAARSVVGPIPTGSSLTSRQVRLRAIMGVGTKTEILLFLSTTYPWYGGSSAGPDSFVEANPTTIAKHCFYSKMSVGKALKQMVKSGWISCRKTSGGLMYSLNSLRWEEVIAADGEDNYVSRLELFGLMNMLCRTNNALSEPRFAKASILAQSSLLRDAYLAAGWDTLGGTGNLQTVIGRGKMKNALNDVVGTEMIPWHRHVLDQVRQHYF